MWATKNVLVPIDFYSIYLSTMYIGRDQQPTNQATNNLLLCSIEEKNIIQV